MKKIVFSEAAFEVSLGRGEKKINGWRRLSPAPLQHGAACPLLWLCISLATHEETSGALQDSDTRVNVNLGGCDKQSEPEPKSLQMDQHQTR